MAWAGMGGWWGAVPVLAWCGHKVSHLLWRDLVGRAVSGESLRGLRLEAFAAFCLWLRIRRR